MCVVFYQTRYLDIYNLQQQQQESIQPHILMMAISAPYCYRYLDMLDRIIGAIGGGSNKQERAGRLGIVVLSERAVKLAAATADVSSELCCTMRQLQEFVAPSTPFDLLLFYGVISSWVKNDGVADDARGAQSEH